MNRAAIFGELISELTKLENYLGQTRGLFFTDPEYHERKAYCYDLLIKLYGLDSRLHWKDIS